MPELKSALEELGLSAGWVAFAVLAVLVLHGINWLWRLFLDWKRMERADEERFDKFVEWLEGDVRALALRAVFGMHNFAKNGKKYLHDVVEIFCAFIRDENRSGPIRDEVVGAIVRKLFMGSGESSTYASLAFNLKNAVFPAGLNLDGGEFANVEFRSAKFRHCNFSRSVLREVDMTRADCEASIWENARLEGVRFDKATLDNSTWSRSQMSDVRIFGAEMKNVRIRGVGMQGVHLERANLHGASIANLRVSSEYWWFNDFRGAEIVNCTFASVDFHGSDFGGVKFVNVRFENCKFDKVNFAGATYANVRGLAGV